MPDRLPDLYREWLAHCDGQEPNLYQAFQGGLTTGALSMRERAVKAAQEGRDKNEVINKIGALSDIPE